MNETAPFIFPHMLSDANRMFAHHLNLQSAHPEKSIHLEQYSRALGFKKKEEEEEAGVRLSSCPLTR